MLIEKLINYTKKINFEQNLNDTFINEIKQIGAKVQCCVKCPICTKDFLCTYTSFWAVSNLGQHIKGHSLQNSGPTNPAQNIFPSSSASTLNINPSIKLILDQQSIMLVEILNE